MENNFNMGCCLSQEIKEKIFYKSYNDGAFLFVNNILKENKSGEVILLCKESGWFSFGKDLKDSLEKDVKLVPFCLSDDVPYENIIKKLLCSVENPCGILVLGDEKLGLIAKEILKDTPICFFPVDFDFSEILSEILKDKNEKSAFVIDEIILEKAKKNKIASGIKSVISKNLLLVEMLVNEAIAPHIAYNDAKKFILSAEKSINDYFKSRKIEDIINALVQSSIALSLYDGGRAVPAFCNCLFSMENFCDYGECEFLAYKIILKTYGLYLSEKPDYLIKKGELTLGKKRAEELFKGGFQKICSISEVAIDDKKIDELYLEISKNENIKSLIEKLIKFNLIYEKNIKSIYAGRKYTVENYSLKQRLNALKTAPFLTEGFCLLKLLYADGFLEYAQ